MIIELATIAWHRKHFFAAIGTIGYCERSLLSVCWKGKGENYPTWFSVCVLWFRWDWYDGKMQRVMK